MKKAHRGSPCGDCIPKHDTRGHYTRGPSYRAKSVDELQAGSCSKLTSRRCILLCYALVKAVDFPVQVDMRQSKSHRSRASDHWSM